MTIELTMLAYAAGLTALLWIPYILARIARLGMVEALTYRRDDEVLSPWAERAKRAHMNALECLVPFAAIVIVAHLAGVSNANTVLATQVYFFARVAQVVLHIAGIPFIRTLAFAVGWLATFALLYQVLMQ